MDDVEVLVLAGTADARDLVVKLCSRGMRILVSTVTDHASARYAGLPVSIRTGRADRFDLVALVRKDQVRALVDATHPFADEAHREAQAAAKLAGIEYVRYERHSLPHEDLSILSSPSVHWASDDLQAADQVANFGGVVFLTTGSKRLSVYADRLRIVTACRLVVRLLPTVQNLQQCEALGIDQADIVALQGPFPEALNRALYDKFGVNVLVTKESGSEGGLLEKVRPALDRGADVVIVERPAVPGCLRFHNQDELAHYVTNLVQSHDAIR